VSDIIKAGVLPVAIEFMDRPCIRACEDFAKAGYPDCEALLIVEVEGSGAEIDEQLGLIKQIARRHNPVEAARKPVRGGKQAHLAGAQIGLRGDGADQRLHVP
jgi:FAD/FMN-containing dehydrogenase